MMKAAALLLLFALCYAECRKIYPTINKNANVDFINMEGGGGTPPSKPAVILPPKSVAPASPVPTTKAPVQAPTVKPAVAPLPTPYPAGKPALPQKPGQPVQLPGQIKPVPVNPSPVSNPATTHGPGSVQSLINYYDSQGKGSPIRPYSYSQAVKQG